MRDDKVIGKMLLDWYDRNARDLPWRIPPGGPAPDPYRVWLSEIMLQQTTVAAVRSYFLRFTSLWPTVEALAAADDTQVMAEWAGLGYYARARNLLACARQVAANGGFPRDHAALLALPGVGPYTAAAISAIAFDRPETVVDGNVERVISRIYALNEPLPGSKPRIKELAARLTPLRRPGDHAQAMMDLGATICTPRSPSCGLCPVAPGCEAHHQGIAPLLPRRAPKPVKPHRTGIAWVAMSGDSVLLERRPPKGLLGATLAFPSAGWDGSDAPPPADADWRTIGEVRHVFTHFTLTMSVQSASLTIAPARGTLHPLRHFDPGALPGLMRKVWDVAKPRTGD